MSGLCHLCEWQIIYQTAHVMSVNKKCWPCIVLKECCTLFYYFFLKKGKKMRVENLNLEHPENTLLLFTALHSGKFAFIYHIQKQGLADIEALWTFCPIHTTFHPSLSSLYRHPFTPQSESQYGQQGAGTWLCEYHYGGGHYVQWRKPASAAARGIHVDPPEEGWEPDHWSTAFFPPAKTLSCGPGVHWPLLHDPGGTMLEEKR